jgi:hypothetical protein
VVGVRITDLLDGSQIFSAELASPAIRENIVADLLAFCEAAHTGALHCGSVNENVLSAIIGLNEAKAFGSVEPLYSSRRHGILSQKLDATKHGARKALRV